MIILDALAVIVFALAIWRATQLRESKRWLIALISTFLVGLFAVVHALYWFRRTNCGALYDRDVGCFAAGGSWDVTVGFAAGILLIILSILVLLQKPKTT